MNVNSVSGSPKALAVADKSIEIQGTAETKAFSLEEMLAMTKLAQAGIRELIARQKQALGI